MLADGRSYGHWVVGSSEIREVDDDWPAKGSRFHHKVGWGPLKLADHTEVVRCEPPRILELKAKARPLGTACVTMELHAHKLGTRVVMIEDAGDRMTALVFNPLTHLLVRGRNVESLRRLKSMVEGRGPSPAQAAQP
jgi:hypothetical protein